MTTTSTASTAVRALLEHHWDDDRGWCVPHPGTYPHLWLWDSCFHAIVWAHLRDPRGVRELTAVLAGAAPDGMVPHMRYGAGPPDTWLGPLPSTSSLTQPPIYAHAARVLHDRGFPVPPDVVGRIRRGLDWLWRTRRESHGLLTIVHPWETGNDHSPRFDDWVAPGMPPEQHDRSARTRWNKDLMRDVELGPDGTALSNRRFVVAPAGFNAYAAHAMAELTTMTGDAEMAQRSQELATTIDDVLWHEPTSLWRDLAVVHPDGPGGVESVSVPISDGVMPALVTTDERRAHAALAQLTDPGAFGAAFGPANVARHHPRYDPRTYWRGPAWPPLSYLLALALRRWDRHREADLIAEQTLTAAAGNGWSEYWDPETGDGLGATPQTWTGLALVMRDDGAS